MAFQGPAGPSRPMPCPTNLGVPSNFCFIKLPPKCTPEAPEPHWAPPFGLPGPLGSGYKCYGNILLCKTSVISIMVSHFDTKQRCFVEKNAPIAFILPRWWDGAESLGIKRTSCLCFKADSHPLQQSAFSAVDCGKCTDRKFPFSLRKCNCPLWNLH